MIYISYFIIGLLVHFKNPFRYIRGYKTLRGIDFYTGIKDWLGGYPYEYASISEIEQYFIKFNSVCVEKKEVRSLGCNEFLFRKDNV